MNIEKVRLLGSPSIQTVYYLFKSYKNIDQNRSDLSGQLQSLQDATLTMNSQVAFD